MSDPAGDRAETAWYADPFLLPRKRTVMVVSAVVLVLFGGSAVHGLAFASDPTQLVAPTPATTEATVRQASSSRAHDDATIMKSAAMEVDTPVFQAVVTSPPPVETTTTSTTSTTTAVGLAPTQPPPPVETTTTVVTEPPATTSTTRPVVLKPTTTTSTVSFATSMKPTTTTVSPAFAAECNAQWNHEIASSAEESLVLMGAKPNSPANDHFRMSEECRRYIDSRR